MSPNTSCTPSASLSAEGAIEKARTAADAGHPTTFFEEPLNAGRYSMLKMPLYPIEGGLPCSSTAGAIGVSGVLPHLDGEIASVGLEALDRSGLAPAPTGAA
jgi:glc operon protein GlcG